MLKKRVGEISMLNLDRIPHDRAGFGSTVHLRDERGDTIVYQLCMPEDADVEKGMISTSSPIGRAILNREEGDDIKVTTPAGARRFELVKVITIHDDAGAE
jgi:transcription elongation factor GreA